MSDSNQNLPNWLKQTQNNSWEPEVFISGIVLFGLFQIPEYLETFRYFVSREVYDSTSDIDNLVAVILTSVQWLTFGLILHLFFRGVWVGLVGLSYVFPNGIKNEELNYKGKFHNRIKTIPDFTNQIILLEKISSSVFSISYFIFMSILGGYIYFVFTILAPLYLISLVLGVEMGEFNDYPLLNDFITGYIISVLTLGLIYLIDFLTLGLIFKKVKYLNKIYYPFYKVISILTLSPLYRNIYYILISNFKKWKVVLFICIFLVITYNIINMNSSRTPITRQMSNLEFYGSSRANSIQNDSYSNLNPQERFQRANIQSDIIKDDVLKLFVTHFYNYEDSIKALCDYKRLRYASSRDSLKLACMKEFYMVSIDDSLYTEIDWYFNYNSQTNHRGILAYVDISHLEKGMHHIDVDLKNFYYKKYDIVEFYKE